MDDQTGCRKNREIPEKTVFPDNERPEPVVAGHAPVPTSFFFPAAFPRQAASGKSAVFIRSASRVRMAFFQQDFSGFSDDARITFQPASS